jgi:hypothetical protein
MKEGLLFNRVGADGGNITIPQGIKLPTDVLPGGTEA